MKLAKKWTPSRLRVVHARQICWIRFPWLHLCSEFHRAIIAKRHKLNDILAKFSITLLPFRHNYISRKVVAESTRDNPEMYCGWFLVHFSRKEFERTAQDAMEVCLRELKERNKSRLRQQQCQEQCIDHIPYYLSGLSRALFFRQLFSKYTYAPHSVFSKFLIIRTKPSFLSPVQHYNFTSDLLYRRWFKYYGD